MRGLGKSSLEARSATCFATCPLEQHQVARTVHAQINFAEHFVQMISQNIVQYSRRIDYQLNSRNVEYEEYSRNVER